jgi:hypothetical protein
VVSPGCWIQTMNMLAPCKWQWMVCDIASFFPAIYQLTEATKHTDWRRKFNIPLNLQSSGAWRFLCTSRGQYRELRFTGFCEWEAKIETEQ